MAIEPVGRQGRAPHLLAVPALRAPLDGRASLQLTPLNWLLRRPGPGHDARGASSAAPPAAAAAARLALSSDAAGPAPCTPTHSPPPSITSAGPQTYVLGANLV